MRTGEAATAVRDELEGEMIESGYLNGAPFEWVGLIIRYGLKDDDKPSYSRINKKHGDLPIAIEIDTHRFLGAPYEEVANVFRKATLISLIHAGQKYGLKVARLEKLLADSEKLVFLRPTS